MLTTEELKGAKKYLEISKKSHETMLKSMKGLSTHWGKAYHHLALHAVNLMLTNVSMELALRTKKLPSIEIKITRGKAKVSSMRKVHKSSPRRKHVLGKQ